MSAMNLGTIYLDETKADKQHLRKKDTIRSRNIAGRLEEVQSPVELRSGYMICNIS